MGGDSWRFVGLYGWPESGNKWKTWKLICDLCSSFDCPLLIGGDYNEILSNEEKQGGANSERRGIVEFREALNVCHLRDLGYVGPWFTWEKGLTEETMIRERLDRYCGNEKWMHLFPDAMVEHLVRVKSDHSPILARLKRPKKERKKGKKNFKFETAWLLDAACEKVVRDAWSGSAGSPTATRLEILIGALRRWSGEKFKDLDRQIDETEQNLKVVQSGAASKENLELCSSLEAKFDDLCDKQEAYWYLRSRVSEIKDGDRNTKYFHHKASQRRKRNEIRGVFDADGVWREEEEDFEDIVQNFYVNLFISSGPSNLDCDNVLEAVTPCISREDNELLLRPFSKDEIFAAISAMQPCKALGPDGLHVIFYQKFWHIVGDDIFAFVNSILNGVCSPELINNTNIALIPKVKSPTSMSEFRPISLCNVLNKIASKAIVMRLKSILPDVIFENQSAFVPGRLIIDNAL